jgi:type IV fimbrial biogenesis protein FimT
MERGIQMQTQDGGNRHIDGFTLIELLIVMTIAVLVLALGMPSFVDFIRDYRAGSMMSAMTGDIQFGRSEAVKRNSRVLFCARASATSSSCTGSPSASAWMNGWLVCYDRDADGSCDASTAADPNPIRIHGAIEAPLAISGPAATLVLFPVGSASAAATFTVTGGTATTRTATIAASGSVTTTKTHY